MIWGGYVARTPDACEVFAHCDFPVAAGATTTWTVLETVF